MSDFVDTNIFVRLLTRDDPEKSSRCLEHFRRANRGEVELITSEAVVAETVYVLSSPVLYATPREDVANRLSSVLVGNGLRLHRKDAILGALQLYGSTNLHFIDCLCVAHARRETLPHAVYSYDRDLDRIQDIRRLEP